MLNYIIEPFQYQFMQQALLIGSLTAVSCSLVGIFMIHKNYSALGLALSNSVLPGIIIAAAMSIPLIIGALFTGLLSTFFGRFFRKHIKLKEDTIIGLLYTGFLALGVGLTFVVHIHGYSDVIEILFGNILAVSEEASVQLVIINIIVILFILVRFKSFVLYAFDKVQFRLTGGNYGLMDWTFVLLTTLAIISSIQAVGILLTIANLTIPVAGAGLLCRSLVKTIILSIVTALISLLAAIYLSYYFDLATGALIVVCNGIFFVIFFIIYRVNKYLTGERFKKIKSA